MARRIRIDLLGPTAGAGDNGGALGITTGNSNQFDWPGGRGVLMVEAATGGNIALQVQGPSGVWIPVINFATTTDIACASGKMANFEVGAGPIRAAAGAATAVTCSIVGVPLTAAG